MPGGYERVLQEFQDIGFLELWIKNPSPEEMISLQRISTTARRLASTVSFRPRPGGRGNPTLGFHLCFRRRHKAHASED